MKHAMRQHPVKQLPNIIWWLGYGGLIPFFALTAALLLDISVPLPGDGKLGWWLAAYAAVVLSFIGAVHWGVALGMQDRLEESELGKLLLFSVIPTLVAWFSLLLPTHLTLYVLAALIVFAYFADSVLLFRKLAPGYGRMRLHLTIIVALLLGASGVAVGDVVT
ncbi:MAG: DUF3429 domain-containing protein [Thiothrix sp.]